MNRLVCLGWISKPERKEKFSFETRVAPLRTRPKLQRRFLTLSPMRLSHNSNLELILRAQRNASHRGERLRSRLFANIGIRSVKEWEVRRQEVGHRLPREAV